MSLKRYRIEIHGVVTQELTEDGKPIGSDITGIGLCAQGSVFVEVRAENPEHARELLGVALTKLVSLVNRSR